MKILTKNFFFNSAIALAVVLFGCFFPLYFVEASVAVTAATGGANISADKAANAISPAWTTLGNIVIASQANNDIAKNQINATLILTVPSGWVFNPGVGSGSVSGSEITFNNIAITSSTITFTYSRTSKNSSNATLTISGIQVRSTNGSILPNLGNILRTSVNPGTATIVGIVNDVTNFGSLSQVVGAKNKLTFTTQPSSSVLVNTDFTIKPIVALQDQFGTTVSSDNTSVVTRTAILSTQICGGLVGSGILTSIPASGALVVSGLMTYTAMQYSIGEIIRICATSPGVISALSSAITVNNVVPTTTSISPSTAQVGAPQFTITVNGTGFIPSSTVLFGGITEPTTYVSSTQLTATIPTGDFPTVGNYNVRVFNPTPGGGQSNSQTFTVTAAVDTIAPTVTAFSIPSTANSLTVSIITFTATDNVGVTEYLLTETASIPLASDPSWSGTAPVLYVFSTAGSKILYAWAKDTAGNISSSLNDSVIITLPDTTAPAAISDLATSNPSNNSIDVSWIAPGDDNNIGTATSYDLRYSTSIINDGNFASATTVTGEPIPSIAGSSESMTVTGLSANTLYYFAIKTSDEVPNTSNISNIPNLITSPLPDTITPSAVSDLSVSLATISSITVSWTTTGDDNNIGTAASYDLRYSTSLITSANFSSATQFVGMPVPLSAGNIQSVEVTGLNAGTEYYFALKVLDEIPNSSDISNVQNLSTLSAPDIMSPADIYDLSLSSPTTNSISVSWTAPGDDGGIGTAFGYDLRYSDSLITSANFNSAVSVSGLPTPSIVGSSESKVVSGLSPGTTYYFAIKTYDETPNYSNISNVPSLSTISAPDTTSPLAISDLTLSLPTTNSISVSWTAPGDDNNIGTAAGYDLRYSKTPISSANFSSAIQVSGEPIPSLAGTPEFVTVSGLNEGTIYYFAIKTYDDVNNFSAISNLPNLATSLVTASTQQATSGGVQPTLVSFSGHGYSLGKIKVYRRSLIEQVYRNDYLPDYDIEIDAEGNFNKSFIGLLGGNYLFALESSDRDGVSSGIISFTTDLISGDKLIIDNIFMPPTVSIKTKSVTKGRDIKVFGYAYPGATIELRIDSFYKINAVANTSGYYESAIDTQRFSPKSHLVEVRQIDENRRFSSFSVPKSFTISKLNYPQADFNADGNIDIKDWSIFLFRWKASSAIKEFADMNLDGKVDILDFSVFLKAMKGL